MAEVPDILLDRRSGRSSKEFEVEQELSFDERVALFESAEYSYGFAETQHSRGYGKEEVYGETREIEEAITIFRESAEFHATRINESEIAAALESKQIDPAIAEAVRDRRADAQKRESLEAAVDKAMGRKSDQSPDRSASHEEQNRDDDQSR